MAINIQEIVESWKVDEPRYSELGKNIHKFLRSHITECEILPEIQVRPKELLSIIKKIKKNSAKRVYSYKDVNDKLGVRIICTFQEELDKIDGFIHKYFIIKKAEYKKADLDFDKLDYVSNHYDVLIKTDTSVFNKLIEFKDLLFEIQVRTLNQHAWSNAAHTLSYKQDAELASGMKRRVYRLLSLYEIADDEFSLVNNVLISNPDNPIYSMIRKLEGKIYKYAQVDYDRDLSIYVFRVLLSWLSSEQKINLISEVEEFIKKIQVIFNENRIRFYELPFLTQPEIFLIWYCMEKYHFTIKDKWENNFDSFELEQISTLWGKQIN
jgi:ppGpp synthetase/RelA/SpoT-type nucleotidyltranferase